MRFRAELNNAGAFSKLITSLTPLSKVATLKLKHDSVHLVCLSDSTASGVQVWSQIATSSIFDIDSMRLESNNNNEIYLELSTDAMARALKSTAGATMVVVKLAKKGGLGPGGTGQGSKPVLTLVISSATRAGRQLEITQDVGVKVKTLAEIEALQEPLCPTPDVNILLPPLLTLRTVCERLRTISSSITISANHRGEFRLKANSDDAKVETEWRGLKHPQATEPEASQAPQDPTAFHSVTVDVKNLLKFLASYSIATTAISCICEDHCAIFYVYVGNMNSSEQVQGGVLTFFVPAITTGDDN